MSWRNACFTKLTGIYSQRGEPNALTLGGFGSAGKQRRAAAPLGGHPLRHRDQLSIDPAGLSYRFPGYLLIR
jgi:hypothetical protein